MHEFPSYLSDQGNQPGEHLAPDCHLRQYPIQDIDIIPVGYLVSWQFLRLAGNSNHTFWQWVRRARALAAADMAKPS